MKGPAGVLGWTRFVVAFPFTMTGLLLFFAGLVIGDGVRVATAVFVHLQSYNDE